ncbi:MAG: hypothetical protein ACTSU5_04105 [Promethearchaeota archaeon]
MWNPSKVESAKPCVVDLELRSRAEVFVGNPRRALELLEKAKELCENWNLQEMKGWIRDKVASLEATLGGHGGGTQIGETGVPGDAPTPDLGNLAADATEKLFDQMARWIQPADLDELPVSRRCR